MSRRIRKCSRPLLGLVLLASTSLPVASGVAAPVLEDPTRPPERVAPRAGADANVGAAGALRLESVFLRGASRIAVIDGQRLQVGDRVGGARVLAIELSGVRLRDASGDWLLKLTGELLPVELGNE